MGGFFSSPNDPEVDYDKMGQHELFQLIKKEAKANNLQRIGKRVAYGGQSRIWFVGTRYVVKETLVLTWREDIQSHDCALLNPEFSKYRHHHKYIETAILRLTTSAKCKHVIKLEEAWELRDVPSRAFDSNVLSVDDQGNMNWVDERVYTITEAGIRTAASILCNEGLSHQQTLRMLISIAQGGLELEALGIYNHDMNLRNVVAMKDRKTKAGYTYKLIDMNCCSAMIDGKLYVPVVTETDLCDFSTSTTLSSSEQWVQIVKQAQERYPLRSSVCIQRFFVSCRDGFKNWHTEYTSLFATFIRSPPSSWSDVLNVLTSWEPRIFPHWLIYVDAVSVF